MKTGTLTPRTNKTVDAMRFSGGFAQPDGFASVLTVTVNQSGDACLTLEYRTGVPGNDSGQVQMWSVTLNDHQRNALGAMLSRYQPRDYERFEP